MARGNETAEMSLGWRRVSSHTFQIFGDWNTALAIDCSPSSSCLLSLSAALVLSLVGLAGQFGL
jgi:hypothetical protein